MYRIIGRKKSEWKGRTRKTDVRVTREGTFKFNNSSQERQSIDPLMRFTNMYVSTCVRLSKRKQNIS